MRWICKKEPVFLVGGFEYYIIRWGSQVGRMGQRLQFDPKMYLSHTNSSSPSDSERYPPIRCPGFTGTLGHDTMLRRSFLSCPKSAAGSCDCCLPSRVWWGRLISASCICEGGALRCPLTHFTPQLLPDRLKLTDLHPRLRRHPINFNQSLG
jgi:hypothetical protein